MKASPLLRAWLARLAPSGVTFKLRHLWTGWDEAGRLQFATPDGVAAIAADATVLALGGASWPRLGSDGTWIAHIVQAGITVAPLQPANCGALVAWSDVFRLRFAGQPLKRIEMSVGDRKERGEAIVTTAGLEGGAIYALSAACARPLSATAKPCSISTCVPTCRWPICRNGSPRRAPSVAGHLPCARPPTSRLSRSACCTRRAWDAQPFGLSSRPTAWRP
jgi:predicted flavoprotein YhiN